jgi:hypothetical protein
MRRKINSALFVFFFLVTLACQPEKKEVSTSQQYWAEIYARYLAPDQTYKTELTFMSGDSAQTALPTRIDGNILIENQPMPARQLSESLVRYQLDYKATFRPEIKFNVRTSSFDRKELPASFKTLPAFEIKDQQIRKSIGGQIILSTPLQLSEEEGILIMLSDVQKQTASITISGPAQLDTITLLPEQLTALSKTGTGNIYLLSKKKGILRDKDISWAYLLEYYTEEQSVEILE